MSAGVKTTELWLTLATDVGLVAAANAAYALARGLAKTATPIVVAAPPAPPTTPAG
jgi:hypothetical protein